jgi:hypothetical protein
VSASRSPVWGRGYVYIIQFDTGVTKVGQSQAPTNRLRDHASLAAVHGRSVKHTWVSGLHVEAADNETALKVFAQSLARTTYGNEYFAGPSFEALVGYAKTLPMTLAQPSQPASSHLWPSIGTDPYLYTLAQVSVETGISLRFLQDGARARRFEHLRLGRTRRMTRDQVDQLLRSRAPRKSSPRKAKTA